MIWVELFLYVSFTILIYRLGGRRGLYSCLGHLCIVRVIPVFLGGWSFIFISIPILLIYYYVMYRIAEILIPFANPDDKEEAKKHFGVLFWYSWGLQYPVYVVTDHAGRNIEQRITGKFTRRLGAPGIIWAHSHHAVGVTKGTEFSRVAGPGIVFTNRYERPDKVIDLRTQIRSSEIQALTKDGVSFIAILVVVFSVDNEDWSTESYHYISMANPMLRDGKKIDHVAGSYPFSSKRVREVIRLGGASNNLSLNANSFEANWDFRVLGQVEMISRQVLSQYKLNELWNPKSNNKGASAIEEISKEILNIASTRLRRQGIRLYASRVVNFEFPKSDGAKDEEIPKQQLELWSVHWTEKAIQAVVTAESTAALEVEKVRAKIAEAQFAMFEEITKKTHKDENFARKMIAMLLLISLGDFAKQDQALPDDDQPDKLNDIIKSKITKRISEMFPNMYLQLRDLLLKGKE